jgi:hypothetical protein
MAIGRKDTTPLLEVHRKAPEATPRLQLEVDFREQHKTRRVCASVAEHGDRKPPKVPRTCAKEVSALKLGGTNYEHWLVWRNL